MTASDKREFFLKSIHIQGFKSFADKIKLDLQPGLCVIVGPNGSGKSNAADAVRWVLGEQSAKSLRGSKMEDVIFAGSATRKPVGMAEVSLVFDNSKGLFPLAYEEVVVTRRVFRDGEGQYLINKTPCRLKDIQELFMDTGSGKEGFSIIGQGRVEEILNLKSDERRLLIEEVAGISKFRLRKKEALKKLEDTQQNIDRLNDIITEVQDRLEPLKVQAETAKSCRELSAELEETEIKLIVNDLSDNHQKLKKSLQDSENLNEELTVLNTQLAEEENSHQHSKYELAMLDEQLQELQASVHTLESGVSETNHEISLVRERTGHTQEQLSRLEKEIGQAEEKMALSEDKCRQLAAKESELEKDLAQTTAALQTMEKELAELREMSGELRLEELKTEIFQQLADKSKLANELTEFEHKLEALAKQEKLYLQDISAKEREKEELLKQIDQQNQELQETEDLIERLQAESARNRQAIEQGKEELLKIDESAKAILRQLDESSARQQALQTLEDNLEGYYKGVKETVLAYRKGHLKCHKVYGTLAENIEVDAQYELALETALGPALQNIVVEKVDDAKQCIAYLKKNNGGRATFLPLESIKGGRLILDEKNLKEKGVLGLAVDLIRYDRRFEAVMEFLLGKIVITENLDSAIALAKRHNYRFRIVTLQGDQVNPGGSLTGGSAKGQGSGLLSRARVIEDLGHTIKSLRDQHNQKQQEYLQKSSQLEDLKEQRRDLEIQLKACQEKKNINAVDRKYLLEKISRLEESLKMQAYDLSDVRSRQAAYEKQIAAYRQKAADWARQIESLQQEQAKLEDFLKQTNIQVQGLSEQITAAKVEAARREQEYEQIKLRRIEENENRKAAGELWEEKKKEYQELLLQVQHLNEQQESAEAKLQELTANLDQQKYKLIELRKLREEANTKNIRLEEAIQGKQRKIKEIEQQLHQCELRIARLQAEWEAGCTRLQEEFGRSWEDALVYRSQDKKDTLQAKVIDLKGRIEELGPVNYAALEEYPQALQRFEFLTAQKNDLVTAADSLYALIGELDENMIKRFKQGFQDVNEAFGQVFNQLFNGGHAELQLDDPDNLLETGVRIIAQPPGKKAQHLSLLSGGERAFTAIALLFAFLKVKPSPFCLLDEIEAALDDANVKRFVNYLRTLSHQTQFILISHRRGTMESADRLYGITMEESGVSKLLTVEMDQTDHEIA